MIKRVLNESDYLNGLNAVIEENYFPSLEKRNLQSSFLASYSNYLDNPVESAYHALLNSAHTLSSWYCSQFDSSHTSTQSLTSFIVRNTSEDNSSFEGLLATINAKRRLKLHQYYRTTMPLLDMATYNKSPVEKVPHRSAPLLTYPQSDELSVLMPTRNRSTPLTDQESPTTSQISPFKIPSGKNPFFFYAVAFGSSRSVNLKFSPAFKKGNTRFQEKFTRDSEHLDAIINYKDIDLDRLTEHLLCQIKFEYQRHPSAPLCNVDGSPSANGNSSLSLQNNKSGFSPSDFIPDTPDRNEELQASVRSFKIPPIKPREALGRKLGILAQETNITTPIEGSSCTSRSLFPSSLRSQRSARAILTASPAVRRMIGASIRKLESLPLECHQGSEWDAVTPKDKRSYSLQNKK